MANHVPAPLSRRPRLGGCARPQHRWEASACGPAPADRAAARSETRPPFGSQPLTQEGVDAASEVLGPAPRPFGVMTLLVPAHFPVMQWAAGPRSRQCSFLVEFSPTRAVLLDNA